jgi:hypothetical protein
VLILFKSGRRQEYLQENLRILSGSFGDAAETTYSRRWLDPILTQEPPVIGERALIVLSDSPYEKSLPIRFATVSSIVGLDETVTVRVELAERADPPSGEAWQRFIATANGPLDGAFLSRTRTDRAFEDELRVPGEKDERVWRKHVERLAATPGYDRSVRAVESPAVERPDLVIHATTVGEVDDRTELDVAIDEAMRPGTRFFDLTNRGSALQTRALERGCIVMSGQMMQRLTNEMRVAAYLATRDGESNVR